MRLPRLDGILNQERELQPVLAKARDLRALAGLIDGFLSADLARQARVANYREGEIVLAAATSAAAAKLRLLGPSLCRFLTERRWQVNSVQVRVQPNKSRNVAPHKATSLSSEALNSLRKLHQEMVDSPAREALGRLLAERGVTDLETPRPRREPAPPGSRKPRP